VQEQHPRISVVTAWYNRADHIRPTVESILAQEYSNFEYIIINDGSTDSRVREILSSYSDSRLRVIDQENTGFTRAIRRAVAESDGTFIAVQGAGDLSMPNRLKSLSQALVANPHCIGVASATRNQIVGGHRHGEWKIWTPPAPEISRDMMLAAAGVPITHGEAMYRRSVYDAVGGYRTAFRLAQDKDLWLRMCSGGPFLILDDVLYQRNLFTADGINTSVVKTMIQKLYSIMASECAAEVDARGYDIVDVFGDDAVLFRSRDNGAADFCAKAAIKYARADLQEDAELLARLAIREKARVLPRFAAVIIRMMGATPAFRRLGRVLLANLPIVDKTHSTPILSSVKRNSG
jgi:glycosyltransferase involved in cell wall biosynthesis